MTLGRATATSLVIVTTLAPVFAGASFETTVPETAVSTDTLPNCSTDLDLLERKIHQNYAGYVLELRAERLARFASMKAAAQTRARNVNGDDCFYVLRDFVEWFADPHLFVYQSTRLDTAESARRAQSVARHTVTEPDVRAYFTRRGGKLDPIEGIWYDRGLRVAILPDSSRAATFVAVVLNPDTSTWDVGAVRARLARRAGGGYDVDLLARNYAVSHLRAQVYRHVLLRFSPGLWGKEFPLAAADSGTLDPVDPHRPTLVMRGATPVFSIPSHDPAYKGVIDSLVLAKRDLISHTDRMIIDVRGNEGGASFTTEYLEPFVTTKEDKPDQFPGTRSVMLSSDDQIAYARQGFGSDTSTFVRTLLARLRAAPGELVPLNDPSTPPSPRDPREWVVTSGPRVVGVLTDGGTVSAGEVLVLNALRSHRATVFGAPTAGALDYQSVNIVRLSPREPRWLIGYPTITRSADLPTGGMRGRGIPPQVPLDLERVRDPVWAVDTYLARRK